MQQHHTPPPSMALPMMLPLRLRNHLREGDARRAQELFSAFRDTPFSTKRHRDRATDHGPGALFRDEVDSMAHRAKCRNLSLYKTERDVNPTQPAAVDAIYHANQTHDLSSQIDRKGNIAPALKSATPRFASVDSHCGPGAYSPERFTGAFPVLLERVTPAAIREEKQRVRHEFERSFAIVPATAAPARTTTWTGSPRKLPTPTRPFVPTAPLNPQATGATTPTISEGGSCWPGLQSAPLKPALTPKNAYTHHANRQLVLHHHHHSTN